MDYSTDHQLRPLSERPAVFSSACELIQQQLPPLLKRVLRDVSGHEQWPLSDKDKLKLLQLLQQKERIVVSSFMFHLKQNLESFEKSASTPLRVVPRAERSKNQGIYAQFNESLMQRLSSIIGRPAIPLTENPVHLFNLKQSWHYAIDSLFLGDTEKTILVQAFDQQLVPQIGAFYRALDTLLFNAGIMTQLPVSRLSMRNPDDYSDTVNSSLGNVGIEFTDLIMRKRSQQAEELMLARELEQIHDEINHYLGDDRKKLDRRQRYFFDNLWMPYLSAIAMEHGTESKNWSKAIRRARQFNDWLLPRSSRLEVRHLLEGWTSAEKALDKALNKLQSLSHQKRVLRNFFDRSFEAVLKRSIENTAQSIRATRPLSAQEGTCREAEDFRHLFDNFQMPVSVQLLDRISTPPPLQSPMAIPADLREGDWAEMKQRGSMHKLLIKLAWKAADLSKYIFVDRSGRRICELNHVELQKKIDSGEIKPLSQLGFRATNQNLSTLRSF